MHERRRGGPVHRDDPGPRCRLCRGIPRAHHQQGIGARMDGGAISQEFQRNTPVTGHDILHSSIWARAFPIWAMTLDTSRKLRE
ncbi:hypothetical protein [Komagataeibacter europaeus]|uniref:hypothetical protein n=1 Tax=Komagataeibacter europaeus TaxID=33995 RepID=UPI00030571C6|nr:hypothetical protein [Komagataeibacter europaeus]